MMTPMQRTKAILKKNKIINEVVERYFPKSRMYPFGCTKDFLGIIDLLALDNGVIGIQVCGNDFASHKQKISVQEKESTIAWLSQPGTRLQIWGWRKLKKVRGGKATTWTPRVENVFLINNEIIFEEV